MVFTPLHLHKPGCSNVEQIDDTHKILSTLYTHLIKFDTSNSGAALSQTYEMFKACLGPVLESVSRWIVGTGSVVNTFFISGGLVDKDRLPNFMASNYKVLEDVRRMVDVLRGTGERLPSSAFELVLPESVEGTCAAP